MNNSTTKADLTFTYDAAGNRVKKLSFTPSTGATITTHYIRDASGNVMATYELETSTTIRFNIYGSSRLGTVQSSALVNGAYIRKPYLRQYELSNHLGNVLATVSAVKLGVILSGSTKSDYYSAYAISGQDYYPFGMTMPGRFYNSPEYRYGFNGKENDIETGYQDYGMRMYNPRLARFFNEDPITKDYPELTPYQFASNTPISCSDLDGLEKKPEVYKPAPVKAFIKNINWVDVNNQIVNFLSKLEAGMLGNEPDDFKSNASIVKGGNYGTKNDGSKVHGCSPIQATKSTSHEDITPFTSMVNVGYRGGKPTGWYMKTKPLFDKDGKLIREYNIIPELIKNVAEVLAVPIDITQAAGAVGAEKKESNSVKIIPLPSMGITTYTDEPDRITIKAERTINEEGVEKKDTIDIPYTK